MPPYAGAGRSAPSASEREDFMCRVKYLNRLPDLPADPKFLAYHVDLTQYVKYAATSLEKEHRRDISCDTDMGMKLNLLTPQPRKLEGLLEDAKIDAFLCQDESLTDQGSKPVKMDHSRHVAWLRKSQYILNDFQQHRSEGGAVEKQLRIPAAPPVEFNLKTAKKRIEAIQDTFESSIHRPKRHPEKSNLTVVEEIPLLPNFDLAKFSAVIVTFDNDPAPPNMPGFAPEEVMGNAMLRGMTDENEKQFVAYFLPTNETLHKLVDNQGATDEQDEYVYKLHRELNLPGDETKRTPSKGDEQIYALNIRENAAMYTDLETNILICSRVPSICLDDAGTISLKQLVIDSGVTMYYRVKLFRPKTKAKKNKSRLVVRFRQLNATELDERKARMETFEMAPPEEDEELRRQLPPVPEAEPEESGSEPEATADAPEEGEPTDEEPESEIPPAKKDEEAEPEEEILSSPERSSSSDSGGSDDEGSPKKAKAKAASPSDSDDDSS